MARDLLSKYVWIVDTIRRHGTITRNELNEKWMRSAHSEDGRPLTRRTFYNYRQAIADIFQIDIECNPSTFEYYIAPGSSNDESITDWLLNSVAVSDVLAGSRELSDRIFMEDVPSARTHLPTVIGAMKEGRVMRFTYTNYTRPKPTTGILLEPYFLKIFRQRWYITGLNRRDHKIKTYALDRMTDVTISTEKFEIPEYFDPREYFRHSFGIIFEESEPCKVMLRADARTAKYLRELPLHPSQEESIHDEYSIFTLYVRPTSDFIQEILSYGPRLTVLGPRELRDNIAARLRAALDNYK